MAATKPARAAPDGYVNRTYKLPLAVLAEVKKLARADRRWLSAELSVLLVEAIEARKRQPRRRQLSTTVDNPIYETEDGELPW
jgi:hypothetical protein